MNSHFEEFSKLPHLEHGQPADTVTLCKEIKERFQSEKIGGRVVPFTDENPLRLALTFLYLIESGATPLPIAAGTETPELPAVKGPLQYVSLSSGTTGQPKPLHLSYEKALKNARAHAAGFRLSTQNTLVQVLPVHHSFGLIAYVLTPLIMKIPVDFRPGLVGLRTFKTCGHQVIHLSPSQARFILKDRFDAPVGVEKITIGAGALSTAELNGLQKKFPDIEFFVSYGLTEAGPRVTAGSWTKEKPKNAADGWVGHALPGVELAVFNEGKISSGGTGALCIKSPSQCLNLQPEEIIQGWLKTRDQVTLKDGDVYFLSRGDDIIKCGGFTLFPAEMENQFRSCPDVTDAVVLKTHDAIYDEVPVLFLEGSTTQEHVNQFISAQFSPAVAPRRIFILKKFPRLGLEKVDRAQLKKIMETQPE